jgi:predicted NBD/HSP70 family sugar kinase
MKKIYLQKAKTQIARPTNIRDINKQIVLNYVRARSPISRAEIARETELQRSTVSSIVEALKDLKLIEEIGEGNSTGGRKPTLLKIRNGTPVAIGVDVMPRQTTVAVADLIGKVLEKETFETSADVNFMTRQIIKSVSKYADKYRDEELEVGMSLPGIIDYNEGTAFYIPYFQWKDWNIGEQLSAATGLNVIIDNDANAIALAELWFGRERIRKIRNFITVLVGDGIGTGIIFEGQIYRGERGAAGEFGHMIVGDKAPTKCSCGSYYCWEAQASEKAIIARYQKMTGHSNTDFDIEDLIELANQGDAEAIQVFDITAEFLGIGISNLIVGLNPQAIIVSGKVTKAWNIIVDELHATIEKSIRQKLPKTEIIASSLGIHPTLIGAISLVLVRKFASAS